MDNTILGHDFLVYWNPDVDWQEGSAFPPGDFQYPDSSPSSFSSSDHRVIAYCSNLPVPTFLEEKAEPSIKVFLYSMILSHPPSPAIRSLKDDEYIEDLETIRKTLLPIYHDYADFFFPVQADKLPPHWPYNHQIKLTGPATLPGPVYSLLKQESSKLQDYIAENS
ncbi:hypothetical protein VP01_10056g1 [Puccinia sorghi]|uniref:Uncharacterized protein n=1 Tax=Puccinia sorghi TaxID=27349 RepID=A0A0L6VVK2_9BASI|nr:hypothetical protein VP01_10056g1 [Puccinia sorghi]